MPKQTGTVAMIRLAAEPVMGTFGRRRVLGARESLEDALRERGVRATVTVEPYAVICVTIPAGHLAGLTAALVDLGLIEEDA